jgi:hypothetical protein
VTREGYKTPRVVALRVVAENDEKHTLTEPVWDRECRARRDAFQKAFPQISHTKSLASSQWWPGCSSSEDIWGG